ncbi:cupin-like domain-containing protein [Sinomicrobium oceani]|uniref:cupin-like domain-containing protein n=1 Tax=Sinomicrobium oceani TaxID=1150368 RepID=UPI00227D55EF|nr:cupin-like domain-containing protein [Sinomicrobium oceani]
MNLKQLIKSKRLTHIHEDSSLYINRRYFNENFGFRNIPAVFRKAFKNKESLELWDIGQINKIIGENKYMCENMKREKKEFAFKDFAQRLRSGYSIYLKIPILSDSALCQMFEVPKYFTCWYLNSQIRKPKVGRRSYLLYIGGENTATPLHQDSWEAPGWLYLFKGTKIWFFYPSCLNSKISKNVEGYDLPQILSSKNDLDKVGKPLYCVQRPGDLVFIPPSSFHAVINIEPTIAITDNFINEIGYENVVSHFKYNYSKKSCQSLRGVINEGFKKLCHD